MVIGLGRGWRGGTGPGPPQGYEFARGPRGHETARLCGMGGLGAPFVEMRPSSPLSIGTARLGPKRRRLTAPASPAPSEIRNAPTPSWRAPTRTGSSRCSLVRREDGGTKPHATRSRGWLTAGHSRSSRSSNARPGWHTTAAGGACCPSPFSVRSRLICSITRASEKCRGLVRLRVCVRSSRTQWAFPSSAGSPCADEYQF